MATEIRIVRPHALGLARARRLAWAWAEKVERDYGMRCTVVEGDDEDRIEFARAGVSGQVTVAADRFDLSARLGLLLAAFSDRIEQEIGRQFDALLAPAKKKATKKR